MRLYGLGSLGATVAARILGGFFDGYVAVNVQSGANFLAYRLPPDMDTPYSLEVVGKFPFTPNFPYGFDVDPDAPV